MKLLIHSQTSTFAPFEVLKLISNLIPHYIMDVITYQYNGCDYLSSLELKLSHVNKRGPWRLLRKQGEQTVNIPSGKLDKDKLISVQSSMVVKSNTVPCLYNMVNYLPNPQNRPRLASWCVSFVSTNTVLCPPWVMAVLHLIPCYIGPGLTLVHWHLWGGICISQTYKLTRF